MKLGQVVVVVVVVVVVGVVVVVVVVVVVLRFKHVILRRMVINKLLRSSNFHVRAVCQK